jgi:sugar transferase (PEP-CTERM/EpsH1 system associated)
MQPSSSNDPRPLVMHVVYRFGVGGLENGIVNLINLLPHEEFRHSVVALTECDPRFCERVTRSDVDFIELKKPPGQGWRVFRRIGRLFSERRPAIVHTRNLAALEMQVPAWFAGVPVRLHGEHGRDMSDPDGTSARYRVLRRLLAPFVTQYVALSADLEHYLVDAIGIGADRVSRICNGVDERKFSPSARLAAVDSPADAPLVVGTVGRLDEVKGQHILVEAVAALLRDAPGRRARLRVVICGDGPTRASIESCIASHGLQDVVEVLGERADVPDVLRSLDVFLLPSLAEGISNTILEAMACGLPVVATDVGGNSELVAEGESGYLVPPADPHALAAAIARYLDDAELRRRHGREARAEIERTFSLSGMVRRYGDLYRAALTAAAA